ncbi:MAG: GGDEF domain-containing protein [Chloroflexi bacterium]|nr:GGDEF domain-containing protein [Chloroflexota bacterium]
MEDAALAPSLLTAVRIMARDGDLEVRLDALADQARALATDAGASFLLHDDETDTFVTPEGAPVTLDESATAALRDVMGGRRPAWQTPLPSALGAAIGASRGTLLPLVATEGVAPVTLGVLILGDIPDPSQEVALALADLAAIAIQQERLRSALDEQAAWQERLARTDRLTGLADRLTFLQMLELEVVRATRQGTALAVVVFAVDDLAGIAVEHGGRVADDILRVIAATLADKVRLVDTVARIAPDELAVIAPGDPTGTVARRVRDAVTALPAVQGVIPGLRAGIAHHPRDGATAAELMGVAQDAIDLARGDAVGSIVGLRDLADIEIGPTA